MRVQLGPPLPVFVFEMIGQRAGKAPRCMLIVHAGKQSRSWPSGQATYISCGAIVFCFFLAMVICLFIYLFSNRDNRMEEHPLTILFFPSVDSLPNSGFLPTHAPFRSVLGSKTQNITFFIFFF